MLITTQAPTPAYQAPAQSATIHADHIRAQQIRATTVYANKIDADNIQGQIHQSKDVPIQRPTKFELVINKKTALDDSADGSPPGRPGHRVTSSINLGAALEAFILEHEYCGELDAAVEDDRVWMTCTCGAVIVRTLKRAA